MARRALNLFLSCVVVGAWQAGTAWAEQVSVAVAANFAQPMRDIALAFARDTGHRAIVALGSTGRFYAQITHGAPYQVLLAADQQTPARLQTEGLGVAGSRFTYAIGKLVLWSPQARRVDDQGQVLRGGDIERIALADPKLAPYGAAALEVMGQLGLTARLAPKFVQGESVAQAYQFVASGNASVGFIALSQVFAKGRITQGSAWIVPTHLYTPLRQDAVLLSAGRDKAAATALMTYLRGDKARTIMASYGYAF